MIKIIYIIGRLSVGGAEKLLLDFCRKINKDEFDVSVVVLQNDNPLASQFEEAGVKLKFFHKRSKRDFKVVNQLAEYLQTEKPDIVHTHLFTADFFGGKAALKAKVPVIISTRHQILSEGFPRKQLSRRMRRKFTKVVAISEAVRSALIKEEKLPFEKVELIYNGIDVNRFYIESPKLFKTDGLKICSVGRLSKEKGHKHLIRACCFLKNKDWHLTIVGDGPLRAELASMARLLGVEDKVKFAGLVEDVRPYYEDCDIFVLPSTSEGLSLVILEAAAAGRVVVATNVGGVGEIIKDNENGFLFKPKNIEQLVRQINWIDENREEAKKMAERLQKEAAERFDVNAIIKKYEELYKKLKKEVVKV
ncbi:MAG: glycosyltransferase [Parcubacteria group bacterium]